MLGLGGGEDHVVLDGVKGDIEATFHQELLARSRLTEDLLTFNEVLFSEIFIAVHVLEDEHGLTASAPGNQEVALNSETVALHVFHGLNQLHASVSVEHLDAFISTATNKWVSHEH